MLTNHNHFFLRGLTLSCSLLHKTRAWRAIMFQYLPGACWVASISDPAISAPSCYKTFAQQFKQHQIALIFSNCWCMKLVFQQDSRSKVHGWSRKNCGTSKQKEHCNGRNLLFLTFRRSAPYPQYSRATVFDSYRLVFTSSLLENIPLHSSVL